MGQDFDLVSKSENDCAVVEFRTGSTSDKKRRHERFAVRAGRPV